MDAAVGHNYRVARTNKRLSRDWRLMTTDRMTTDRMTTDDNMSTEESHLPIRSVVICLQ